ncbi:GDSL-type esterase/lipase family protein [Granulicella arctica]|uniref:Lysophospholipase L1-like esterase n=1 Tax=Granulicella arctica TaxID=940613 RepID=A0A7Y9PEQ7_9BACT|nr:GDSL-type esterase/lipase family protein [Granulicella arctica]NYF78330.1 lysophospholipase L1-like esterase [Granulicella arctica]
MTFRPGHLSKLLCLLLVSLPIFAVTTKHTKARPRAVVVPQSHKRGTATLTVKGKKKARIPRTLRTVPVSPVVRLSAVDRVQADLTETASSPFLYPGALHDFFKALEAQQSERTAGEASSATSTVRILQFGDSHTAADIFTGELRARMQQQFGDGGLGFQFPGHPFAGYHLAGSLRSQTAGWFTEGNRFTDLGDGDLGLGGISISTSQPGQAITLETTCTTLQLHFLQQPGGGRLQFSDNGSVVSTVETDSRADSSNRAGTFSYSCASGQHDFEFTTLDHAPVKLLGIITEQPGVTYECLGINGAIAPLMLRWNQALFDDYLRQRDPSLIVLAYGTNESGSSAEHLESYPADFGRILDNLHRIAPAASILVLGPADRSMASHRAWHPFAGTDRIITMQKEACRLHGCTFWDTRRRMGGFGSMQQWVAAGWAQPDRTHLTGTGYRALADALDNDLVHAYNLYQQHPRTTVEESSNGKAPRNP